MKRFYFLCACILGCVAVGCTSALLSPIDLWYDQLRKPVWTPPGWSFGVAWSILYVMMGMSLSLVLEKGWAAGGVKWAVTLFAIQLALNFAWSPVFFRFHSIAGAMGILLALWLMLGWTIAACWSVRDIAGAMLLPYWAWVTFALALNVAIWRMN